MVSCFEAKCLIDILSTNLKHHDVVYHEQLHHKYNELVPEIMPIAWLSFLLQVILLSIEMVYREIFDKIWEQFCFFEQALSFVFHLVNEPKYFIPVKIIINQRYPEYDLVGFKIVSKFLRPNVFKNSRKSACMYCQGFCFPWWYLCDKFKQMNQESKKLKI